MRTPYLEYLTQHQIILTFQLHLTFIMDNSLYQDLFNYLTTLTYPMEYDNKRKTHLQKISTQYFVDNHTLYRRNKKGKLQVIKQDQIELILFHLHRNVT